MVYKHDQLEVLGTVAVRKATWIKAMCHVVEDSLGGHRVWSRGGGVVVENSHTR